MHSQGTPRTPKGTLNILCRPVVQCYTPPHPRYSLLLACTQRQQRDFPLHFGKSTCVSSMTRRLAEVCVCVSGDFCKVGIEKAVLDNPLAHVHLAIPSAVLLP